MGKNIFFSLILQKGWVRIKPNLLIEQIHVNWAIFTLTVKEKIKKKKKKHTRLHDNLEKLNSIKYCSENKVGDRKRNH